MSGRAEIASFACAANRQPQSIQELRCNAARKADTGRDRSEVRGVYGRVAGQTGLMRLRRRSWPRHTAQTHRFCGSAAKNHQTGHLQHAKSTKSKPAIRCARVQCLRCGPSGLMQISKSDWTQFLTRGQIQRQSLLFAALLR